VTDYGVRLTVRVGILTLACAPFRVVLLYTVSPLRGDRFHRPFQLCAALREHHKYHTTHETLWKQMAKELYNDTMVSSQFDAFTSAVLDSDETVENLSKRSLDRAVGLPELEGTPVLALSAN
jgi:hypothetical protein